MEQAQWQHAATEEWPARGWWLAAAGAVIGSAAHALTDGAGGARDALYALATFLVVTGVAAGLVIERARPVRDLSFAAATGAVVALVTWWNLPLTPGSSPDIWRIVCAVLAGGIAVPLYQGWRGAHASGNAVRLPYAAIHRHAWTDLILAIGAVAFLAITWLLTFLLAQLFALIGLNAIERLLRHGWFGWPLSGAALGAAMGLLRDRAAMLAAMQRVVTTILSVLAPVLAAGLLLFLAALPFTGLAPLWRATSATTPILLCCVAGALILINATIGDTPEEDPRAPVPLIAVMVLSGAILPLAVVAAISTGARIAQHGLTPDRLWALVFTAIACAYGLAYAVALVRRRQRLAGDLRVANLRLALTIAAGALFLATPLAAFDRLSAHDQLARLESGRLTAAAFDWTAMRFDYGPAGIAVLRRLATRGTTADIRTTATRTLARTTRYDLSQLTKPPKDRMTVLPRGAALPPRLYERLDDVEACGPFDQCVVLIQPDPREVVIVNDAHVAAWRDDGTRWRAVPPPPRVIDERQRDALKRGEAEIRTVQRRQLFVGGQPVGDPLP
ncbi:MULTISPECIES: DUF4153 domain-containing protein [Sphingomonas]|uniref:DUF4153 domain-containing protein n=1 Tax=Sphingomonas adhaesiva TaxID=28212 RepID=A0A2A4I7E9_9SPHN|nr:MULTISPECIES: DUF4153 domain-containing protein [Sphingomonas]PCG14907.1 DUF4153 domain-containing protein [Sphingomonas adhaesiva]PZU81392.1 MAG: DUF4153 domain-containing protein [Sphingomonas sp.]